MDQIFVLFYGAILALTTLVDAPEERSVWIVAHTIAIILWMHALAGYVLR